MRSQKTQRLMRKFAKLCRISSVPVLFLLTACSSESPEPDATLRVSDAYMVVTAPGQKMAAIYLDIHNPSGEDRVLAAVETDIAGTTEIHRSIYDDGVMRMRHIHELPVPSNQTVVMEPGGYHIMLMDMAEPPAVGDRFVVKLDFDQADTIPVEVEVRPVR